MPLKWTSVAVKPGGIDTRSDPKLVPPSKMADATNVRFGVPGVARKRQGFPSVAELSQYDASSGPFFDTAIAGARALFTRDATLWLAGAEQLYGLSSSKARWRLTAQIPQASVAYGQRSMPTFPAVALLQRGERCTANGVTMLALEGTDAVTNFFITAVFYDAAGVELARTTIAGAIMARAVVAGTAICLFYASSPTANTLSMATFDTAAIRTTPGALVFPTAVVGADLNSTNPRFDADVSGTRVVVAYNTSVANTLKFGYVLPGGALDGAMTTISTAAAPTSVACAVEPTAGTILVSWGMDATPRVDGQMFNAAKASLFASVACGTPSGTGTRETVTCIFRTATLAEIFLDTYDAATAYNSKVQRTTLTTAGVVTTSATWMIHALIAGKPWRANGRVHVLLGYPEFTNVTIPTLNRTFFTVATGGTFVDPIVTAALYPGEGFTERMAYRHPPSADVAGNLVSLTPFLISAAGLFSVGAVTFDYSYVPLAIESGRATYLTGSSVWMVDGANVVEVGFMVFPENISAVTSAAAGSLVGGVGVNYSFRVYFEWSAATGERHQSTTATDVVVPLAAGQNTITLTIPTLTQTNKGQNLRIAVYRTGPNGTLFYRDGVVANDPTVATVNFVSTQADATLTQKELDYRSSVPSELDNIAPPPASVIAVGNNRVFLSGLENPDQVLASKLQDFGVPVNFNDALTIALPPAHGAPITALAMLGDELLVFREQHIYTVAGGGPDNVGLNGGFEKPVTISDDLGCSNAKSVVRIPPGILFESRKGIYLLGNDRSLTYVGADVERDNPDTITSAVAMADVHEVRFTLASGSTMVYEYLEQKWALWTIGGVHSALWRNTHVILPGSTGLLLQETPGVFQDNGLSYSMALETGWIAMGGLQGYQRVRDMLILGVFKGDHSLRIRVYYDDEVAAVDDVTADVSAVIQATKYGSDAFYGKLTAAIAGTYGGNVASGLPPTSVYQLRHFFLRPKCQAVKVRIEDVKRIDPAGVIDYPLLEAYSLNEFSFRIGLKAGTNKVGPDRQF